MNEYNYKKKIERLERELAEAKEKASAADVQALQREIKRLRAKIRNHEAASGIIYSIVEDVLHDEKVVLRPIQVQGVSRAKGSAKAIGLLHITDLHFGKVTSTYDTSIAEERLQELTRKTIKALSVHHKSQNVKELRVYMTGDMVEAENIFPHQAHQIDSSVFEQACYRAPAALASMIVSFLGVFDKVKVVAVKGNHGRIGRRSDGFAKETNWDSIVYRVMGLLIEKAILQSKKKLGKFELIVGQGFQIVDELWGHKNLLFHGDNIRGFAGFPWYGVGKKLAGWIDSIGVPWENAYFGHFHQYVSGNWNNRLWYCSGTLESDNEFALEQMASCSLPQQRLQLWTEKYPAPVVDMPLLLRAGLDRPVGPFFRRKRP